MGLIDEYDRRVERWDWADPTTSCTPVECHGGIWVKRDDLFEAAGVKGGKARTCWHLAQGAKGLITAGSRASPQVNIVSQIAKLLGIPCRVHIPQGELGPELLLAKEAGAEIVQWKAGYNNVIIARAREDARHSGWREIPFGMECQEAVDMTAGQVRNLPSREAGLRYIVVPVGSGMSLAGILTGMRERRLGVPVLGIAVGADPTKRLNKYAPKEWPVFVQLIKPGIDYHKPAPVTKLGEIDLDPIYEAKCLPFLTQPGGLFWIVGRRSAV